MRLAVSPATIVMLDNFHKVRWLSQRQPLSLESGGDAMNAKASNNIWTAVSYAGISLEVTDNA